MTISRPLLLALACASGLSLVPAPAASAQDARLEARVDGRTRAQLQPILDSARVAGVPIEPLVDKALEGATKGASRPRIVAAVRTLSRTLGAARVALGGVASDAEIVAAADALEAGIRPNQLGYLRGLRTNRSITVPLAVLADLVARGVPPDTAAQAVLVLARAGAVDAQFIDLRIHVERDIGGGIAPVTAVVMRSEALAQENSRNALKNPVVGREAVPTP